MSLLPGLLFSFVASADSWGPVKPELIEHKFKFGEVTIVRGTDGRENQMYPLTFVKIFSEGKLVALYPGLSFADIAGSKDNKIFVAVSNWGRPDTAAIVFDSKGKLGIWLRHYQGNFKYCSESVTLTREWYDTENPDIKFEYSDSGRVTNISINSCDGNRLNIGDLIWAHNKKRNEVDGSGEPPIR